MDLECKIPRIKMDTVDVNLVVKSVVLRRLRMPEELEDPEGVLPLDPLLYGNKFLQSLALSAAELVVT